MFLPGSVPFIFGVMKIKLLLLLFIQLSIACYSQNHLQAVKKLDSLTEVINKNFRNDFEKKDTGVLLYKTGKLAGRYKHFYYISKKDSSLQLVVKNRISPSGHVLQESFYYWSNQPITAFRMDSRKEKLQEREFYFMNSKLFEKVGNKLLPSRDNIKKSATENLKTSTKL